MLGYDNIPDVWKAGIPPLADKKFAFTRYSFNEIVASTVNRAYKVIEGAGGQVTPTEIVVPKQEPQAAPLEQWNAGVPLSRIEPDQSAWKWTGSWTEITRDWWGREFKAKETVDARSEATLVFEGTGVAIVGGYSPQGGRADVYLDGKTAGQINAWLPERTHDNDYWHITGVPGGTHTVRIVVRDDADSRSTGKKIRLDWAVIYGE
jgi:hypothetical protein